MKPASAKKARVTTPAPSTSGDATPHVLVPLDFSPPSKRALEVAARFAQRYGARIHLITVLEPRPFAGLEGNPLAVDRNELEDRARSELLALGAEALGPERLASVVVRAGKPFEEILAAARSLKVDLIIIATRGYTGVKHMLLGSTTERVIRSAPCPVLTVQPEQATVWP